MLLCVLNVVAHLAAMPGLPERIPMHWGVDGGVNGWGPRWMASVLGALPLTFLALFYVVPRIDPKGAAYAKFGGFYQGFVISFTVFMCAISWLGELTVWTSFLARARSTSSCPGRSARSSSAWVIIYSCAAKLHARHQNAMGARRPRQLAPHPPFRRSPFHGGGR